MSMQFSKENKTHKTDKNVLSQLWYKYFPYWPLFILFLFLSLGCGWLYLRYTAPVYEAKAAILIKDPKKGEDNSKVIESLNQLSTKKTIENEIEVISTRALMLDVVNKLHLYAPVLAKGEVIINSAYSYSPIVIEAQNPASIRETNKNIPFKYDYANKKVITLDKTFPANEWVNTPYGVLKFIPNNIQVPENISYYFQLYEPRKVASDLLQRLDVTSANKLSSVINLKIKDYDPRCAEDILNELMASYNAAAINEENNLAKNTLIFVEDRLNSVGSQLNEIEKNLQQYKSSAGAIDISSQGTMYLQSVGEASNKYAEINTQLAVLDQVENYVKSKTNTGGIVPSTVGVSDPLLTDLVGKLYNYELQYEKIKRTTGENNPMAVSIKDQIEKVKPSIVENISNLRSGLVANKNNLNGIINKNASMLNTIPQKERNLVEISRNQATISSLYNFLLQKREETSLALTSTMANSRIIDKAQSSFGPVGPNSKLIYLIALLAAFILAAAIIAANELLNPKVLFRYQIEDFTAVPVIGEIVYNYSKESIVTGSGKRTFIAEQFRNLRTSLPYLGIKGDKKTLLITSTISGEGKSFVVANLGISLAMAGKKVVLLEFDLSNPSLGEKLQIQESKGLSEFLRGEAEKEDIIKRVPLNENLFIVSAGEQLPVNPSELIMDKKVPEFLAYLSDIFDHIIIDTAPVGLLSDAYVLSSYSDATLYVVRHRYTPKASIERLDENNKINELKNMAIIFNGVKARGFSRKKGYGYGYGYGYISDDTKGKKKDRRAEKKGFYSKLKK